MEQRTFNETATELLALVKLLCQRTETYFPTQEIDSLLHELKMLEKQEPCAVCQRGFVRDEMMYAKESEQYFCSTCGEMLDAEAEERCQAAQEAY
jgi:hypothetical protein